MQSKVTDEMMARYISGECTLDDGGNTVRDSHRGQAAAIEEGISSNGGDARRDCQSAGLPCRAGNQRRHGGIIQDPVVGAVNSVALFNTVFRKISTSAERHCVEGGNARRNSHRRQAAAQVESTIANGGNARRDSHRTQAGTSVEGIFIDVSNALRDSHRTQAGASFEGAIADGSDALRDADRGQVGAAGERLHADGGDAGLYDYRCDISSVVSPRLIL